MSIGYRIKNMMELRGMRFCDLSRATGLHAPSIRQAIKMERVSFPNLTYFKKLAKALGCTPGWLLQDREWTN